MEIKKGTQKINREVQQAIIEFLYVLMELLAVQEKTNREYAYMFGKKIEESMETERDIFKIISRAGFGGRRK